MPYPDLGNVSVCLLTFRQARQQFVKEHHSLQNTWMVHTKLGYFVYMYFSPVILYTLPGESLRSFPYQQDLRSKRLCWQGNCTTVIPRLKCSFLANELLFYFLYFCPCGLSSVIINCLFPVLLKLNLSGWQLFP